MHPEDIYMPQDAFIISYMGVHFLVNTAEKHLPSHQSIVLYQKRSE